MGLPVAKVFRLLRASNAFKSLGFPQLTHLAWAAAYLEVGCDALPEVGKVVEGPWGNTMAGLYIGGEGMWVSSDALIPEVRERFLSSCAPGGGWLSEPDGTPGVEETYYSDVEEAMCAAVPRLGEVFTKPFVRWVMSPGSSFNEGEARWMASQYERFLGPCELVPEEDEDDNGRPATRWHIVPRYSG